jgi:type I restriction enzyme S subunit
MEVKPGYKATGAWIIPEEWYARSLGSIISLQRGHDLTWRDRRPGDIPVMGSAGQNGFHDTAIAKGPGVILGRSGASFGQAHYCDQDFWPHNTALYVTDFLGNDPLFIFYFLKSVDFSSYNSGGAQQSLNRNFISQIVVGLPRLPEQRAIATALSDVDALLGALDRLIAKKRDLKQAAMQQLLTGQTRLPGFGGEWEVKRLGDHLKFLRNGLNSRAELRSEGPIRYLHYGDVHASRDIYLAPARLPSLPMEKAASLDRLRDGDLVFADASEDMTGVSRSVELREIGVTEVVSGLHTIAVRFDRSVFADGFKGLLQFCPSFVTHLRRLVAGTKVYATNRSHIASAEMLVPSIQEQTAIAAALSDMDAELTALEARRDKTLVLKQAMMQELLTGRTRLV